MSRKRIAEKLGVSMTVIIGNENATLRVSVSRLFSYAKALGVSVNMLLNGGLIIEEGVCYKTRDGHKAFVFEVNNIDNKCYASVTGPTGGTFCITMQGRVFEDKESNNDLIDLWREDNE